MLSLSAFGRVTTVRHPNHKALCAAYRIKVGDSIDSMTVTFFESTHRRDAIGRTADGISGIAPDCREKTSPHQGWTEERLGHQQAPLRLCR